MPGFPPPLPPGRVVDLPGRGRVFVRDAPGPSGAPCVVLLHGWLATADLNWFPVFRPLAERFRVVAPDHRGHGGGIRSWRPFRLADCADDVDALCDALGTGPVIVAGYSMGGPIAQLTWRRHRDRVRGMVLCATSRHFPGGTGRRAAYTAAGFGMALTPAPVRRRLVAAALSRDVDHPGARRWLGTQVEHHDVRALLEAGYELGRFDSSAWIGGVDVPTAVVVTTGDLVVPTSRQRALAAAIPGARSFDVEGDHSACVDRGSGFVRTLVDAVEDVARRGRQGRHTAHQAS